MDVISRRTILAAPILGIFLSDTRFYAKRYINLEKDVKHVVLHKDNLLKVMVELREEKLPLDELIKEKEREFYKLTRSMSAYTHVVTFNTKVAVFCCDLCLNLYEA